MVGDGNVMPTLAVSDLAKAKEFYEGVLGLTEQEDKGYEVIYKSGDTMVEVYQSEFAGTNKATAATWEVANIEEEVDNLKDKGVSFEHYPDMPDTKLEGDLHVWDGMKAAWFKDPDGNILCLHT